MTSSPTPASPGPSAQKPSQAHIQGSIQGLIDSHKSVPGGLLPLLHAIQDQLGFIPSEAVGDIAKGLNLSRAEVHGVVTYYHFFRSEAPGKHVVQVCRAEACQACGAEELMALAEKTLGCASHSTTANGAVTLEPVYCLGMCASSPAIQVNDTVHARVTPNKLNQLLRQLEATA
jgi:formate dehydrogenase subunit gamma